MNKSSDIKYQISNIAARHIVIDARIRRTSTGRYTDRLITHLQKIDTKNRYTILVEPDDDWQMTNPNFSTKPAPFQQFSFNPLQQIKFARLIYSLKPDLVHFTMTQQPLLYFGKIVTTTHDLGMFRYTRPSRFSSLMHKLGILLLRFMYWQSHRKSKRIIVPSQFVAEDIANMHPFATNRLVVTYESSEPPLPGKSKPLAGVKKPFIMHVGAPFPHKNIDRLLKAFELLKTEHPDLQLVLPGKMKGQFKADFDTWLAANAHKAYVITPGFVDDRELKWLYENTAVYVLPSLNEGFGLPGLEAMAHGAPVASSDATCLPEVYGDAALYFDPFDIQSIAVVVNEIITDSTISNKLRTLGHKQVSLYSWKKMARQTLDVYRSVLKD